MPLRPRSTSISVLAAALAAGLVATPSAPAASASPQGTVTVTASGAAAKQLRRAGVRLQAPGGGRATTLVDGSARLTFTPTSRTVRGTEATLPLRGELRFRRGARSVRYTGLRFVARASTVVLTGRRAGGTRVTLLQGAPSRAAVQLDATRKIVSVRSTTTTLSRTAARTLRTGLRLRAAPGGSFGSVGARAGAPSTGGSGTTGSGTTQGGGATTSQPASREPVPLVRPASAADVVAATLVWRVRESFIRYVNTGEGTSASGGATADPAENLPDAGVPLVYQFRFPFRSGWSDAASGSAAVTFSGAVRFRYSDHTIDLTTADPELELNGGASRMIFRVTGAAGSGLTGARAALFELRPSAAASRTVSPDGKTVTYDRIPAVIPAGTADSVFAGFYLAGAQFGTATLTYTTT